MTLIIVNPNAASGRAASVWRELAPLAHRLFGDLRIAVTDTANALPTHLAQAYADGIRRVIGIGGDGTNFAIINNLINMKLDMDFGCLPIGTGHDWARTIGIPKDPTEALHWLHNAKARPTDLGVVATPTWREYFLNIASAGIGGEIDWRVNNIKKRRFWTFYSMTVQTLLTHTPERMSITLDGQPWWEDRAYIAVVANGRYFGHGMKAAPNAEIDDGLFDVVLVEGMPRLKIIAALNSVFSGKHILRNDVHVARAKTVEIISRAGELPLDLDGESWRGNAIKFEVMPNAVQMLR